MAKVSFKTDICKGCGLCVDACPKKIIALAKDKLNAKGHSPAIITDQEKCIGCGQCYKNCASEAIVEVKS